jgi:cellulose biosynthesis protein BcsQ
MAMTRVFVFTNHKGGVGKSTSATNTALGIAGMLRRAGAPNARVLLIDTDSQAHATLVTTGTKDYGVDNSLYTVLMADRQNAAQTLLNCIVQSTWDADLHVLPASPMLEGAERELMGIAGAPYRLADPLSRIINRYAAVVIDTRPSFSLMTEMGLIAATDAIVPVEPRYLETVGLIGDTIIFWMNSRHTAFWVNCCLVWFLRTKRCPMPTKITRVCSATIRKRPQVRHTHSSSVNWYSASPKVVPNATEKPNAAY